MNTVLAFLFFAVVFLSRFTENITLGEFFISSALIAILVQLQDIYRRI